MSSRILVIRLGALGDFVQSSGPFAAIRTHHRDAHVTLLTTRPFAAFAAASPWFDAVWADSRPRLWQIGKVLGLRRRLREGRFDRVYDLQTSDRSSWYFRLMGRPAPEWSGIAPGCSHPDADPDRDHLHTLDRQRGQLAAAGIPTVPPADLSWVSADTDRFALPRPFVLLCPGGAPHRPAKRWPSDRYATVANRLAARGITPVLLGTASEAAELAAITAACPQARSLAGQTDFLDIVALARLAAGALGNDTGPMHLAAAAGCPCVVLFSHASDPALCAPRGRVTILRRTHLGELPVEEVETALDDAKECGLCPRPQRDSPL